MTQRFLVYVLVGGVCGFGSVFLEYPGIFLALLVLIILAATVRKPADLLRVGAYLVGAGIVGLSIIGPAVRPGEGVQYAYATYAAAWGYALVTLAGSALVAIVVILEIRRRRRGGPPSPASDRET